MVQMNCDCMENNTQNEDQSDGRDYQKKELSISAAVTPWIPWPLDWRRCLTRGNGAVLLVLAHLRSVLLFGQTPLFFFEYPLSLFVRQFHTAGLSGLLFPDISLTGRPVLFLPAFDGLKISLVFVPRFTQKRAKRYAIGIGIA
jgi:hypothetical protein